MEFLVFFQVSTVRWSFFLFCKIEVHKAEWQNATVFAPVLAVACVSGPSLGRVSEWRVVVARVMVGG